MLWRLPRIMISTRTPEELWQHVLSSLKPEMKEETFDLWFKPLSISKEENQFVVTVPNRFFSDWIKTHYKIKIEALLTEANGAAIQIEFRTQSDDVPLPPLQKSAAPPLPIFRSSGSSRGFLTTREFKIETEYDFETFVVGPSNRFAEAVAEAVAADPGRSYNPFFMYGGVGLGKTHLLHSIGRRISNTRSNLKVMYVPSETFINEFIDGLRFERMKDFRAKYRSLDCLLIDDIQFLMGKESSQEEFFYTFNSLYDSQKQIVICSDRPPKETRVGDRLISRFEWGVIADIQPPDLETRIAILRKKSEMAGMAGPEDVILFLATHIKTNIRELEGSMTRLNAYTSLTGEPLTIDTARKVLKDILSSPDHAAPITAETIQRVVARHFNMDLRDMRSKRRSDAIAFPRQIAMYLMRTLTEYSTTEIGHAFGGKDHTTVMHACNKIKSKLSGDPYFVALINKITQDIREDNLLSTPQF